MTPNFATSLPGHASRALLQGLDFTKTKTANDKVATTVEVGGPQVTPLGSPVDGQVAVTMGAPVEEFVTIFVDTSAFAENETVVGYLGDASEVHEASCTTCSTSENKAAVYMEDPTCDKYPAFLNRLCSTPYTFGAMSIRAMQNGGSGLVALPNRIEFSRMNLSGDGNHGNIFVSQFENLEAFPRTDLKYADIPLLGQSNLFDRDTRWRIPGLKGKRLYEIRLYTAFRKEN